MVFLKAWAFIVGIVKCQISDSQFAFYLIINGCFENIFQGEKR
jgi:hypothetical protein